MKRIGIYARVSTKDKSQEVANQLLQLREYCQRQDWEIAGEFIDHESAKRADNRKEFQRMFAAASRRELDLVLVWALDRFSRSGVMETFQHVERLKQYGVEFESFTEAHFRTTGPAGELMLAIAAWIAKQERLRISERTKAGMQRARRHGTKSGKSIGRPRVIVDRVKVRRLRDQNLSLRAIATQMNVSTMTVHKILSA